MYKAIKAMTKLKAVINFNKREEIRLKIALITLLVLLTSWTVIEIKALIQPLFETRVVLIENVHASIVEIPEEEVAAGEVYKDERSDIKLEQGEKSKESTTQLIERIAKEKGFKNVEGLKRLAFCESSLGRKLVNHNKDTRKTTDNGLWMINDYWHSEVSYEQAMDFEWSTNWTIDRISKGYLHEWNCSGVWGDLSYKIQ